MTSLGVPTMTSDQPAPLDRHAFDAAALMANHPPRVHNANKQVVLDIACPPGAVHRGTIGYTRWAAMELPEHLDPVPPDLVLPVPGFFDYQPVVEGDDVVEWHVNFADPHLFVAYAGGLFAQDEMQVAEHPGLAALKQALVAAGVETRTDGPDRAHAGARDRRRAAGRHRDGSRRRRRPPVRPLRQRVRRRRSRRGPAGDDPHRPADRHQPGRDRGHRRRPGSLHAGADPQDARHRVHGLPRRGPGVGAADRQSRRGSWSIPATGAAARSAATAC